MTGAKKLIIENINDLKEDLKDIIGERKALELAYEKKKKHLEDEEERLLLEIKEWQEALEKLD